MIDYEDEVEVKVEVVFKLATKGKHNCGSQIDEVKITPISQTIIIAPILVLLYPYPIRLHRMPLCIPWVPILCDLKKILVTIMTSATTSRLVSLVVLKDLNIHNGGE